MQVYIHKAFSNIILVTRHVTEGSMYAYDIKDVRYYFDPIGDGRLVVKHAYDPYPIVDLTEKEFLDVLNIIKSI